MATVPLYMVLQPTWCIARCMIASHACRQFFQSGKTLAIERGKGLNQPVMRVAAQRVARGDWLHVFPEGRVGYAGTMGAFKWGIGKIVCDSIRSGQQ